jgi:hypothetical protein
MRLIMVRNAFALTAVLMSCALACDESLPANEPEAAETAADDGKLDGFLGAETGTLWETVEQRCTPPDADEPVIYGNDFAWGYLPEEMARRFEEMYTSEQRLDGRAWYDTEADAFIVRGESTWGGDIRLSQRLIENVRRHIEHALDRGYARYVFFPDMGHNHFFVPEAHWADRYDAFAVSDFNELYAELFEDEELLVLYHTAEQLQMLDGDNNVLSDREVAWRYFTRNIVGDNAFADRLDIHHDLDELANTVRTYPGHHYFGAGFNVSANVNGCFPYVAGGDLLWFDLSLSDLPYNSEGGDFDF